MLLSSAARRLRIMAYSANMPKKSRQPQEHSEPINILDTQGADGLLRETSPKAAHVEYCCQVSLMKA